METTGIIYRIWNTVNNKSYVGKTSRDFYIRLSEHIKDIKTHKNKRPLYRAMNLYGIEKFSAEILGEYPESQLDEKETEFILYYNSYTQGYNATLGGDGRNIINIEPSLLLHEYKNHCGNISSISKKFNINRNTCTSLLHKYNIDRVPGGLKAQRKVLIEDVNIEFDTAILCAKFLITSEVSSTDDIKVLSKGIRKVCTGERQTYLGLKFSYL
jgi:hypothetical protein